MALNDLFANLMRTGEADVTRLTGPEVAALRRMARREGVTLSTSTTRDYMGRKTTTANLHDGHGNIVTPWADPKENHTR